jgi:coatomer protein complex subunit gamma
VRSGKLLISLLCSLVFISESVFSLAALEAKLVSYVKDPTAAAQPFDVSAVPKISRAQAAQEAARKLRAHDLCKVPDL